MTVRMFGEDIYLGWRDAIGGLFAFAVVIVLVVSMLALGSPR